VVPRQFATGRLNASNAAPDTLSASARTYFVLFLFPRLPPRVTPSLIAFCFVAWGVRFSLRAITVVFVFSRASVFNVFTSSFVHGRSFTFFAAIDSLQSNQHLQSQRNELSTLSSVERLGRAQIAIALRQVPCSSNSAASTQLRSRPHGEPDHDRPKESEPNRNHLRYRGLPLVLFTRWRAMEALHKATKHCCHRLTRRHGSPIYKLVSFLHVQREGTRKVARP
jgi:hypothetical protein